MHNLQNRPGEYKAVSTAARLPNPDPLTMDYAARRIASRYNVSPGMARIVAELVSTSVAEVRR
jgi:hypothetical protein